MARTATRSADSPEPEDSSFEPYVEWIGGAGYREVTKEQWEEAGIKDQDTVFWTRESPRLPLSQLTDEARQRLAAEPDFHFVTEAPKEEK